MRSLLVIGLLLFGSSLVRAGDPRVDNILPRGGQRGRTMDIVFTGDRLKDAHAVLCFTNRIRIYKVKPLSNRRVRVTLRILPDCPLGETAMILQTRSGLSNLKTFQVGSLSEGLEVEPNDRPKDAQRIPLWQTMNGALKRRDRDLYAVDVPARQRVSIEVQGVRLGDSEFDPRLVVHGPDGRVIARCDDTQAGRMDPFLSFEAPRSGTYLIEVSEARLAGNGGCWYRLHVGSFPRPKALSPAAIPSKGEHLLRGADSAFRMLCTPQRRSGPLRVFPRDAGGVAPVATDLWVSPNPVVHEAADKPWISWIPLRLSSWALLRTAARDAWREGSIDRARPILRGDAELKWRRLTALQDGKTADLKAELTKEGSLSLHRRVSTRVAQPARFGVRSDRPFRFYLRGELVAEHPAGYDEERVIACELKRGLNDFLIELQPGSEKSRFRFRKIQARLRDHAGELSVPGTATGVITRPGELDGFRFKAKKGQTLVFNAFARRLGSGLDPALRIRDAKGSTRASNDDVAGLDSRLTFRVPADGSYLLEVQDALARGDATKNYVVTVIEQRSGFFTRPVLPRRVRMPRIAIPRGGREAMLFRIGGNRAGQHFAFDPLPEGVTTSTPALVRGGTLIPVVFEATKDAELRGRLSVVRTRDAKGKTQGANFLQTVNLVNVENDRPYIVHEARQLPVAVCDRLPFRLELIAPKVPIVKGSPLSLQVKVHRDKGFKGSVRLRMLWNPPGISSGEVTVPGDRNVGSLPLSASTRSNPGKWSIAVRGRANLGGEVWTSTRLETLELIAPMVTASIGKARGEQGTKLPLDIRFDWKAKAQKPVRAKILNLPRGVSTSFPELKPGTKNQRYELSLDKKAARGRHRNLLLRVEVPTAAGAVVHYLRGGELRIDRPLPPRKGKGGKPKPKPKRGTLASPKT